MITTLKMFYTSVGRKFVMALTGLFLCIYLIEHLYGNLLLYKADGGKAFNDYTEFMTGNLIIREPFAIPRSTACRIHQVA